MHMYLYDECYSYISCCNYCSEYEVMYNTVKMPAIWLSMQQEVSPQKREAKLTLHNDCQHWAG